MLLEMLLGGGHELDGDELVAVCGLSICSLGSCRAFGLTLVVRSGG